MIVYFLRTPACRQAGRKTLISTGFGDDDADNPTGTRAAQRAYNFVHRGGGGLIIEVRGFLNFPAGTEIWAKGKAGDNFSGSHSGWGDGGGGGGGGGLVGIIYDSLTSAAGTINANGGNGGSKGGTADGAGGGGGGGGSYFIEQNKWF